MKTEFTLDDIKRLMVRKQYQIYNDNYKLNIVGIRSVDKTINIFNDTIVVFFKNGFTTEEFWFKATTDPGLPWLKKLMNPKGTAILKPGQYINSWKLALHRGKYEALVQYKPVEVYRDNNLDDKIDINEKTIESGLFGINIHRANAFGLSAYVGEHSAGCQVIRDPKEFTDKFMTFVKKHKELYGNSFTYTLINEEEIKLFLENKDIKV